MTDENKPLINYRICLLCGNSRDLFWYGGLLWCPRCCSPNGSEIGKQYTENYY